MHKNTRMEDKTFDEFVNRQQEAVREAASINWKKERVEWLAHLDRLYSKIESLLSKYVSSRQIRFDYQPIELNEEYIGSYAARRMTLRIGRQEVVFLPVGTLLIGSKGRVDVIGPAGRAQMLLVDSKASGPGSLIHVTIGVGGKLPVAPTKPASGIDWEWRIVARPPERRFIEITQQTLFQLIMEVSNG